MKNDRWTMALSFSTLEQVACSVQSQQIIKTNRFGSEIGIIMVLLACLTLIVCYTCTCPKSNIPSTQESNFHVPVSLSSSSYLFRDNDSGAWKYFFRSNRDHQYASPLVTGVNNDQYTCFSYLFSFFFFLFFGVR